MKSRCALGWLIVGILIQGMQLSGAEAMEGSIIAYNAGPETRSGVALGDLAGLGIALPQGGVTVKDGDRIVPSQLSGNGLAVWITLKGYEHRRLTVLAGTNGASAQIAQPLRHVEDKAAWMTLGKDVTIRIDKKVQGIASLQMGGARFDARPGFDVWVFPETTDKRQPDPWRWVQPNMQGKAGDFTVATLATGPLFTCYHLQWSCDEAKVDERITYCSGDSFARFDVQVELLKPVSEVIFNYNCYYNMDLQNTLFYPAEARPVGRYQSYKAVHFGRYDKAPGYVLGWSPKQGGIGFAVPDQGLFTRFAYAVTDHPDYGSFHGTNNDAGVHFYITARSERLLDKPAGTVLKGTVYPFTASKAEDRDGILARINSPLCLRKANPVDIVGVVQIDSVMALKETTSVKASLRNYSDKPTTGAIGIGLSSFHKDMVSVKTVTDIPAGGENTISTDIVPAVRGPQELWLGGKEAVSKLRINVQPVVAVENVWPNKVLYANDETAKCEVTLKNWKPQPVTVKLETSLYTDIDRQESLDSRDVALQPLERKTVTLKWNTGKREYGCEIRSVVKQGTILLDEGCEYFNIATDWLKVMQSGGERYYYMNLAKWNNFQAEDGTLVPPAGDYLLRVPRNRRPTYYRIDGARLRNEIAKAKEQGYKTQFYLFISATPWASMDFARDPSKVLYKADGQPNIDHDISANIYMPGFRDWISDQVIRSITELGWDSVFLDCSQVPPWYAGLYDWQGRPAGESLGKDPDSVGTAFYTDFCSRISAKYPQFVFMHNPEVFKAEFQYPKSFVAAGRMAMLEIGGGGGQICNKSSIYGQWDSLLNAFATIRATKRRYNVEQVRSDTLMLQNFGGEITTKTLTAICFANGFNTEIPGMPPGSIYADDLRQYMQFGAARYSALIYHDKIRWISPADVRITVDAPPSVRWKDYVFQRDLGDETDLIIHLFQLPPGKYVFRQPERQPILSNLKMTIPALEGMTFKDVWLLSPDRPARAETMKASVKRGAIQITIPDLWIYDVVVARYTKGGRP